MKVSIAISTVALAIASVIDGVAAQTRSTRDAATAYGARLNARGQPATLNPSRVNSRIESRVNSRLALRIERYRPDSTINPAAAFAAPRDDRSRTAPIVAPLSQVGDPE